MSEIPKLQLGLILSDFAQLEREGVRYKLGGKASSVSTPKLIRELDCSGYFYWAVARATAGALKVPHGSQMQRAWCEQHLREVRYRDAARYMTKDRLFVAFIRPGHNGCGPVGHVWLLANYDDGNNGTFAGTLESHGGAGINSRPWNYPTLLREVYSCFELPTT